MIVADTSFLYALIDRRDDRHVRAVEWLEWAEPDLSTTPLALAETDYLTARLGPYPLSEFRADLVAGAYAVEWWPQAPREAAELAERFGDLGLSLTDASLVLLAARMETSFIATFDERHFRAVGPLRGPAHFRLLPADA